MCFIFLNVAKKAITDKSEEKKHKMKMYSAFLELTPRGPDRSHFVDLSKLGITFGFGRLAIMDLSPLGDQPFLIMSEDGTRAIYTICNAEIYNYKYLKELYDIKTVSESDCEIIPHIYEKYGIERLCSDLTSDNVSGEYAIIIIDTNIETNETVIHAMTDTSAIRPMFFSETENNICFASEMKGLIDTDEKDCVVEDVPPSTLITITTDNHGKFTKTTKQYFDFDSVPVTIHDMETAKKIIRETFVRAVYDRMNSDAQKVFFASGGLDSSLVCGVANQYLKGLDGGDKTINTISIGMPGSTDEKYAKLLAESLNSNHTHVELSEKDFIDAVEDVIRTTETYDITSVRATVGQYLLSKWVSENTNRKVTYIGDGSDELFGGYRYFLNAPSPKEYHEEIQKLLREIRIYDVKRADRGVASNGLEARVPFLDHRLIKTVFSIDPSLRMAIGGVEKHLLREAFRGTNVIPDEILFRTKEAFSDGVSSVEKSWYMILQDMIEKIYTDEEFKELSEKYDHLKPHTKEALHYRIIYNKYYSKQTDKTIPHFWLPNWFKNVTEPSARVLPVYTTK